MLRNKFIAFSLILFNNIFMVDGVMCEGCRELPSSHHILKLKVNKM